MKNGNKISLNSERESTLQSSNPVYPRKKIRSIIIITSPMHSCLQEIIDFCHLRCYCTYGGSAKQTVHSNYVESSLLYNYRLTFQLSQHKLKLLI